MAIVCRKCNYEITEDEINVYFWGEILHFFKTTIECINNMYSSFNLISNSQKKAAIDDPAIKQEKKLSAIANQQKIACQRCFKYNGWIRITNEEE